MMMKIGLSWVVTQRVVSIPYQRFEKTCRFLRFFNSCPLKMEPISCPETSVRNYHYWLLHNPKELSSHPLRGGSLKSRDDDEVLSIRSEPQFCTKLFICWSCILWFLLILFYFHFFWRRAHFWQHRDRQVQKMWLVLLSLLFPKI